MSANLVLSSIRLHPGRCPGRDQPLMKGQLRTSRQKVTVVWIPGKVGSKFSLSGSLLGQQDLSVALVVVLWSAHQSSLLCDGPIMYHLENWRQRLTHHSVVRQFPGVHLLLAPCRCHIAASAATLSITHQSSRPASSTFE